MIWFYPRCEKDLKDRVSVFSRLKIVYDIGAVLTKRCPMHTRAKGIPKAITSQLPLAVVFHERGTLYAVDLDPDIFPRHARNDVGKTELDEDPIHITY